MRTWIRRSLIALVGVTVLAGSLAAYGHRYHRDHHRGMAQVSAEDVAEWRGKLLQRAGKELELDAAQSQRLGLLFDKLNEQRSALVGSSTDPHAAMQQLIAGDRFDRAAATTLVEEKTGAVRAKGPEVIEAAADFYDSLQPAQQAKLREFMAQRRGHWRG
ncbi:MAG TPA: Spy/CpxP family protein refolding chaperone [Rubrivivax sp.]|nr:periplasmic heavy metal sensor [Betaproteobacteria bacterium]HRC36770.1 Spy/CpxP family protein refolding chaperone [Rubrivivax sp.]